MFPPPISYCFSAVIQTRKFSSDLRVSSFSRNLPCRPLRSQSFIFSLLMCLIHLCLLLGRFGSYWPQILGLEPAHVDVVEIFFLVGTMCNIKNIISCSSSYGSLSKIRDAGITKSSQNVEIVCACRNQ
jgi:hypothetical protein